MNKKYDWDKVPDELWRKHGMSSMQGGTHTSAHSQIRQEIMAAAEVKPKTARELLEEGLDDNLDRADYIDIISQAFCALDVEQLDRSEANERAAKDAEFRRRVLGLADESKQLGRAFVPNDTLYWVDEGTK